MVVASWRLENCVSDVLFCSSVVVVGAGHESHAMSGGHGNFSGGIIL